DGSRFWASVVITALHDPKGRLLGFTKVTRDITERKRAQEAFLLEMANALVTKLDLHQLLTVISSCLRQVKEFDFATLAFYYPASKMLKAEALDSRSAGASPEGAVISPTGDSPAAWVFNTRQPLLFKGTADEQWPPKGPRLPAKKAVGSGCWLPLVGREGAL